MLWCIAGDIIWSVYEWDNVKIKTFPLFSERSEFTDDTVLTMATIKAIVEKYNYNEVFRDFAHLYPWKGYGSSFITWVNDSKMIPYNSYGNGSAMRVCPIGLYYQTMDEVLHEALKSAEVTHNHPEWIKGAQAVASAVFLAKKWNSKLEIKNFIEKTFWYNLSRKLVDIRNWYTYDETCQWSVPESIISFLESFSFEDAIRNAISIWWDSDTIACITWGIAEAYYGNIPDEITEKIYNILPEEFLILLKNFYKNLS
jgi:ADP-ribosylglycohydrolase